MNPELKKKKTILYTTLQIIGLLVISLIGGCFDFLNFGFTINKISTWDYWQGVIQQMAMYSIALALGYLGKMEREELNNSEYHTQLALYRELLKSKKESFIRFIESFKNPAIKKEYIKTRAIKRLHKLDRRGKDEYKLAYRKALKSGDLEHYQYQDTKCHDYCIKRFKLEQLASDAYIDENSDIISIKYPRINPNCFTENIRMSDSNGSKYKVENTTGRDVPIAMGKKALTTLATAILIGTIVYDPSLNELLAQANGWIAVMVEYLIRIVMVAVSFIQGMWAGKEMFYTNFIRVCQNRIIVLKEYINWRHANNEEDTYIDKFMEAYYNQKKLKEELEETIKQAEKLST